MCCCFCSVIVVVVVVLVVVVVVEHFFDTISASHVLLLLLFVVCCLLLVVVVVVVVVVCFWTFLWHYSSVSCSSSSSCCWRAVGSFPKLISFTHCETRICRGTHLEVLPRPHPCQSFSSRLCGLRLQSFPERWQDFDSACGIRQPVHQYGVPNKQILKAECPKAQACRTIHKHPNPERPVT